MAASLVICIATLAHAARSATERESLRNVSRPLAYASVDGSESGNHPVVSRSVTPCASCATEGGDARETRTTQSVRSDLRVSGPACADARRGLAYYKSAAERWRRKMGAAAGPRPERLSVKRCPQIHRAVRYWRAKARANRMRYEHWSYQYEWRRWLPAKFYRVARCETGVDWRFDSGTYVSAFGIIRVAAPGWNGHNSPRWQYNLAASIQRRYSWSAWGCGGA